MILSMSTRLTPRTRHTVTDVRADRRAHVAPEEYRVLGTPPGLVTAKVTTLVRVVPYSQGVSVQCFRQDNAALMLMFRVLPFKPERAAFIDNQAIPPGPPILKGTRAGLHIFPLRPAIISREPVYHNA